MDQTNFTVEIVDQLSKVGREEWDVVANPSGEYFDPFLSWDFLEAMESSGAATPEMGWSPYHITVRDASGGLVAAMPLYAKNHSQGEFVFDHSWADAYMRAGGNYYPKLLSAVPFTPVTGRRRLTKPGPDQMRLQHLLIQSAINLGQQNDLSSLHLNFIQKDDVAALEMEGLLIRTDQQFHWNNNDYGEFADFLADLSSAKRKNLRKERAKAQADLKFVHLTGSDITEAHWDAFFEFYMDTGARKWGRPYLNRETFSVLGERMSEHLLLIFAYDGDRPIAGALNMIGSEALYGRYWGCTDPRPMLHFETCYYQAIDYAIAHGLKTVEAGAQGGHKLARGYVPVTTYSAHWIAHPGLRDAIDHYLDRERHAVDREIEYLQERTPFKKGE